MTSDPPAELTGAWLRALLERERVVRGSHLPPSNCDKLARNLAGYRELCARDARRQQLRSAIDKLRGLLPGEIEHMRRIAASYRANGEHPEDVALVLRQIVTAQDFLAGAWETWRVGICPIVPLGRWQDFAWSLAGQFRDAMEAANPGIVLQLSNDGPVARYVAAVVPHITGERPSVGAVAKFLQREAAHFRRHELRRRSCRGHFPGRLVTVTIVNLNCHRCAAGRSALADYAIATARLRATEWR